LPVIYLLSDQELSSLAKGFDDNVEVTLVQICGLQGR